MIIVFGIVVSVWGMMGIGFDLSSMDKGAKSELIGYLLILASSLMLALYATVGYKKKGPIHLAGCAGIFILSIIAHPILGGDITFTRMILIALSIISIIAFVATMFLRGEDDVHIVSMVMVMVVTISSICMIFIEDTPNELLNVMSAIVPIAISVSLALFYHDNSHMISG